MGLKASEWIMIIAVVLGPILAVLTQIFVQRYQEKRTQKFWVFSTLMNLRGAALAPDFVRALNYIDVVFHKNKKVRERWQTLLQHFTSDAYKPQNFGAQTIETSRDLLAELLAEMAKELDYRFDHTHIKNSAYYPAGHGQYETELQEIRQKSIEILKGNASINVVVKEEPTPGAS